MSGSLILKLVKLVLKLDRDKLDKKLSGFNEAINENNFVEAEIELNKHIEQHPSDEVALCELALIEKNRGNIEKAIALFERAVKSHASYSHSRYLLGQLYLENEDFKLAETYLFSGFMMNTDSDYATALAKAYIGLNDNQSSIKYLKKAIKLNKYNREAYIVLIELYNKKENFKNSSKYEIILEEINIELEAV